MSRPIQRLLEFENADWEERNKTVNNVIQLIEAKTVARSQEKAKVRELLASL